VIPAAYQSTPVQRADAGLSFGRVLALLFAGASATFSRLFILGFWIFSDLLGDAYDSWIVPVIGFVVLPWTTFAYAVMWGISSDKVAGAEWVVIAFAALLDLLTHAAWRRLRD
jgi:hypothetical protein